MGRSGRIFRGSAIFALILLTQRSSLGERIDDTLLSFDAAQLLTGLAGIHTVFSKAAASAGVPTTANDGETFASSSVLSNLVSAIDQTTPKKLILRALKAGVEDAPVIYRRLAQDDSPVDLIGNVITQSLGAAKNAIRELQGGVIGSNSGGGLLGGNSGGGLLGGNSGGGLLGGNSGGGLLGGNSGGGLFGGNILGGNPNGLLGAPGNNQGGLLGNNGIGDGTLFKGLGNALIGTFTTTPAPKNFIGRAIDGFRAILT